jgi:hypothetical protein
MPEETFHTLQVSALTLIFNHIFDPFT